MRTGDGVSACPEASGPLVCPEGRGQRGWGHPGRRGRGPGAPTAPGHPHARPCTSTCQGPARLPAPALTNGQHPPVSPGDPQQTKSASPPVRRAPPTARPRPGPRLTKAGPARSAPRRTKAARPAGRHRCSRRRRAQHGRARAPAPFCRPRAPRPGPAAPRPPPAAPSPRPEAAGRRLNDLLCVASSGGSGSPGAAFQLRLRWGGDRGRGEGGPRAGRGRRRAQRGQAEALRARRRPRPRASRPPPLLPGRRRRRSRGKVRAADWLPRSRAAVGLFKSAPAGRAGRGRRPGHQGRAGAGLGSRDPASRLTAAPTRAPLPLLRRARARQRLNRKLGAGGRRPQRSGAC